MHKPISDSLATRASILYSDTIFYTNNHPLSWTRQEKVSGLTVATVNDSEWGLKNPMGHPMISLWDAY